MSEVTVEAVADAIYEHVKETKGKKNLKPMDCVKFAIEKFGADAVDKKMGKAAIRLLVDGGRCIYSYAGGSYLTLPE